MAQHYAILEERPDRINRLRFLLHLRGIKALLAIDAAEVINWRSACRLSDAELKGVVLYLDQKNCRHLQELAATGFDLPVLAIEVEGDFSCKLPGRLNLVRGSVDDVLKKISPDSPRNNRGFNEKDLLVNI